MSRDADFASAAMMRLVVAGLTAQGISVPHPAPAGAHVARTSKRAVLDQVLAAFGARAILSISDAAPSMPPEPVVLALRNAGSVPDLLDRWGRLETFSHARHRVGVTHIAPGKVTLHHVSLKAGTRPALAESLVVIGLLTRLAEGVGASEVTLVDRRSHVWRHGENWTPDTSATDLGPLTLSWAAAAPTDAAMPRTETDPDSLREVMANDPLRRWSVAALANHARMSERSLQRLLTRQSTSFSRLLAEARLQVAAKHLCAPEPKSLAEIGFLSGFADQAHFSRDFRKGVGTSPKAYLTAFQSGSGT